MKPRVLIIDDSLTVRMDLSEAFEGAGFSAVPVVDLASARTALRDQTFSLIVLDVLLPDGDGIDFMRELKSSPATAAVPIMLLSTEAQVRDRIRGLTTGADEYIGKPYDPSYVVARARQLVRTHSEGVVDGRRLVLVIDDSATFREAIGAALNDAGYQVISATTGEEGLHAAVNYRPAAVLIDSRLPGISGTTVVRRLREDAALRRTPCLLLTASDNVAEELQALEAGADGFARKDQDFTVVLARVVALLRTASTPAALAEQSSFLGPKKILAVDDSLTYLEELGANLRQEGYDVVLAASGEEALDLLAVQTVDCILLDVRLPGLSGFEVCRRIKSSSQLRDTPLLMLTSLDERTAVIEGINAGADDYIPKSNDFDVIRARVRAALRRKQVEDENRSMREQLLRKEMEASEARARQVLAETRASLLSELHESEERVQLAAEAADLGIWYWDLQTDKGVLSDRCKALFGLPPDAEVDSGIWSRIHPEDRDLVMNERGRALAEHQDMEAEYRVILPDDSMRWIAARGRGLYDDAGNPVRMTGVAMDVTDRRRTQEALVRSEKLASVGRMAATMAHEINNPLEAIMNALFLVSCDTKLSPEARTHLDIAERELSRVAHMTKQTLGFYRENTRPSTFQLSELVDELLNLYSRKLNHKDITVDRRWRTSGQVTGVSGEVRQIVSNLIGNAIDALPPHGTIHLRLSEFRAKHYAVRLTVADNGTGIRREDLPCIFEPFFTTKKDVGTGLGLWVTKQIVDKHSGAIRVRSKPGKGTVFMVCLPLNADASSRAATA